MDDGRQVEIARGEVFRNANAIHAWPGFHLEGYPNRDSISYAKDYGIANPKKFIRGTLRYKVAFGDGSFLFLN